MVTQYPFKVFYKQGHCTLFIIVYAENTESALESAKLAYPTAFSAMRHYDTKANQRRTRKTGNYRGLK